MIITNSLLFYNIITKSSFNTSFVVISLKIKGKEFMGGLQTRKFSTDNILKMQKYLNELSVIIKNNTEFKFLEQELQLAEKMESWVSKINDYNKAQNAIIPDQFHANAFYLAEKTEEIYMTPAQWDMLYRLTTNSALTLNDDDLKEGRNLTTTIVHTDILYKALEKLKKRVITDANKQKNSKNYKLAKMFAIHPNFIKSLDYVIRHYISQKITKSDSKLILSDFAIFLGNNLILLIISTDKMFYHIMSIIQSSSNFKVKVNEEYRESFNNFLEFYKKKDYLTLYNSYYKSFINIYNTEDLKIITDIIILYITKSFYDCESNKKFYDYLDNLYPLLKTLTHTELRKELIEISLQQGNIICSILKEEQIFTLEIISENKKDGYTTTNVIVPSDAFQNEIFTKKMIRPYLHKNNIKISSNNENNLLSFDKTNIHNNIKTTIATKESSYFIKEPFVGVTHKIDLPYLLFILKNLKILMESKSTLSYQDSNMLMIYSLYDLDAQEVNNFLLFKEKKITNIIHLITAYLYNFNDVKYEIITQKILLLKKEYKKNKIKWNRIKTTIVTLEVLFDKIKSTKYIIKGLLGDAVLYSRFKYVLNRLFVDARGRAYEEANFLTIQGFSIAKILLKPFGDNTKLTQDNLNIITKGISICSNNTKFDVELVDIQQNYHKIDDKIYINYLYDHYLNSKKITQEEFKKWFLDKDERKDTNNHLEVIRWFLTIVKKPKYALIMHSFVYQRYNANPIKYLDEYFELDARNSGLQMMSILLKSKRLATLTNLIGNKVNDIYTIANTEFITRLKLYPNMLSSFKSACINLNLLTNENEHIIPDFSKTKIDLTTLKSKEDLIKSFMIIHFENPSMHDILLQIQELFEPYLDTIEDLINKNRIEKWLQKSLISSDVYKNLKITKIGSFLISIKIINTIVEIMRINNWYTEEFLEDRNRFKHAMMTVVYNATSFGRKNDFKKDLKNSNKIMKEIDHNHITYFALIMEGYFTKVFLPEYLPEYDIMKEITDKLVEEKCIINKKLNKKVNMEILEKGIKIENKNFIIHYKPKKMKVSRVNTAFYNQEGKRQRTTTFQIRTPQREIDLSKFKLGFSPNFIQSMDAFVVHEFKEFFINLNKYLMENNLDYFIFDSTNHDTFKTTLKPFLLPIIKYCYLQLFLFDYFSSILNHNENYLNHLKLWLPSLFPKEDLLTLQDFLPINSSFVK
jgi:hypothetical protein